MTAFSSLRRVHKFVAVAAIACIAIAYSACTSTGEPQKSVGTPRAEPNVEQKAYKFQPSPTARFRPTGVVADEEGNIFVVDSALGRILKIDGKGNVSKFAGGEKTWGYRDGPGKDALFTFPTDIAIDSNGNLYVTDSENSVIRKITKSGEVSTIAGIQGGRDGQRPLPFRGVRGGDRYTAQFEYPHGLAVDDSGNLFIGAGSAILMRNPLGLTELVAGEALIPLREQDEKCTNTSIRFDSTNGIAVDKSGAIYVTDSYRILKIDRNRNATTVAGKCGERDHIDGANNIARFSGVRGIAIDNEGNIYVAEAGRHSIRKIDRSGNVATLAGSGNRMDFGRIDGDGRLARFNQPYGIFYSKRYGILVADEYSGSVRSVSLDGIVKTIFDGVDN